MCKFGLIRSSMSGLPSFAKITPAKHPNSAGLWIYYKFRIWMPTWILYETRYESHMDLIPYLKWIAVGDPYMDPIWISVWILDGSYMDPYYVGPTWILIWVLYGSLCGSYMDPSMDPDGSL